MNEVTEKREFLTVDEFGAPVDRRIADPSVMRLIFANFKAEDAGEANRRSRLSDIYNCNLPYNPAKLAALGLGNLANFNTGDLKGFIDARVGVITELALDTCPLIELRPHPAGLAGPQAVEAAETVADEFSAAVRKGGRLLPCLAAMFRECDLFGIGPITWRSPRDYNPVSLRRGQLKFRMDGPILSCEHEVFMFEAPVTVQYFSRLFSKPDAAKKEGWNVEAVKRYLVDVYITEKPTENEPGDSTGTSARESAIIEMRQNRWSQVNQFKTLNLLHALVVEGDGKVRHLMCAPNASADSEDAFLFDKPAAYDTMDQCIQWMPASVVEQEARGSRGIASIVAPIFDANNRLVCQMYDAGHRAGTMVLVTGSPKQNHQQSIQERGPYTIISGDLTPQQLPNVAPNIQQLASLRETGSNIAINNSMGVRGTAGANPERMSNSSDRKTKEEVITEQQNRSRGEQQLFASRVTCLDKMFEEVFRRFMALVKGGKSDRKEFPEIERFIDNCELRGVSLEMLRKFDEMFSVHTNRVLVTGGGSAHAGILSDILSSFGGGFDEIGRSLALRDIVKYRLGVKAADRYRPDGNRDKSATDSVSFAVLENGALRRGDPALVGSDQMHWSHMPVHMQLMAMVARQYSENPQGIQEPQQLLDMLSRVAEHVRGHLQHGAQQPGMQDAAKQVAAQISAMAPVVKGLTMMAGTIERQRRAAAEKQQREMEELQQRAEGQEAAVAMRESDNKARLKMREQDLMHQARLQEVKQKGEIELMKAENEAKGRISRQTERIEQGLGILRGPDASGMSSPPASEPMVDEEPLA